MYLQVTFEQHKESLSRMFRQYQHQESAGSVRSISGVSQSMEQMESVNGTPTEESAPSTVIELTVDSPSSPTSGSSPTEPSDEAEPASITVSNILEGAGEEEQKLVEADVTETQEDEKQSKRVDKEQPEISTDDSTGNPQTLACDREVMDDSSAVEMADDSTTEVLGTEGKAESGPSNAEEGSMNEGDAEEPVVSEREARSELPPEAASDLENSVLGGASVFNEDLVDVSSVSDADDSQKESSSIPGLAGEEEGSVKEEEIQHEQDEGEEMKEEKQENGTEEKTEDTETPSAEHDVTETPKDDDNLEQSSTIAPTTPVDRASETSTAPEASETSASTSDRQPSEAAATEGPSTSEHGIAAASSSGKTKEIKIARLDVSNVASDTERLELKDTVGVIHSGFISQTDFV